MTVAVLSSARCRCIGGKRIAVPKVHIPDLTHYLMYCVNMSIEPELAVAYSCELALLRLLARVCTVAAHDQRVVVLQLEGSARFACSGGFPFVHVAWYAAGA